MNPIQSTVCMSMLKKNGYKPDITDTRLHHEIYLSDPNKCDINKLKTVIRHPVKKED